MPSAITCPSVVSTGLGAQFPVVAHSDEAIEEAAGRFEVQFDAPRAVAFARILG
jgi:hypothetical protein